MAGAVERTKKSKVAFRPRPVSTGATVEEALCPMKRVAFHPSTGSSGPSVQFGAGAPFAAAMAARRGEAESGASMSVTTPGAPTPAAP